MSQNIPSTTENNSETNVKEFFNQFFTETITFPSSQVDAVVGFFESRGFDKVASISTATILLQQAKLDNVNVFQLIDTLKGLKSFSERLLHLPVGWWVSKKDRTHIVKVVNDYK